MPALIRVLAGACRRRIVSAQNDTASVVALPDGRLIVETDMTDIGTGSYTIIAQVAAEVMGESFIHSGSK